MFSIAKIKTVGVQTPLNNFYGNFNLNHKSTYFQQGVNLIFLNQKNDKSDEDWKSIVKHINDFNNLNDIKIGWIKNKLWENYLYAIEATDYGFNELPASQLTSNIREEEISILKDMPDADLKTIKFNMNYFKIFNIDQALKSSNLNYVEFSEKLIVFNFTTIWDDEHDITIYTKNYIFDNIE